MTHCIDTNAYAAFKRGNAQISDLLETGGRILSPDTHLQRIPAMTYIPLDPLRP